MCLCVSGVLCGAYHARRVKARVHSVQEATRRAAMAMTPTVQAEPRMFELALEKHIPGQVLAEPEALGHAVSLSVAKQRGDQVV